MQFVQVAINLPLQVQPKDTQPSTGSSTAIQSENALAARLPTGCRAGGQTSTACRAASWRPAGPARGRPALPGSAAACACWRPGCCRRRRPAVQPCGGALRPARLRSPRSAPGWRRQSSGEPLRPGHPACPRHRPSAETARLWWGTKQLEVLRGCNLSLVQSPLGAQPKCTEGC